MLAPPSPFFCFVGLDFIIMKQDPPANISALVRMVRLCCSKNITDLSGSLLFIG